MSKEVKRFFIMPGAVPVMQSDSPAYTPMTNHETYVHTVPVVLGSDYDALLAERDALKKDAERFHWLAHQGDACQWMNIIKVDPDDFESYAEAVDAAMQGEQP